MSQKKKITIFFIQLQGSVTSSIDIWTQYCGHNSRLDSIFLQFFFPENNKHNKMFKIVVARFLGQYLLYCGHYLKPCCNQNEGKRRRLLREVGEIRETINLEENPTPIVSHCCLQKLHSNLFSHLVQVFPVMMLFNYSSIV